MRLEVPIGEQASTADEAESETATVLPLIERSLFHSLELIEKEIVLTLPQADPPVAKNVPYPILLRLTEMVSSAASRSPLTCRVKITVGDVELVTPVSVPLALKPLRTGPIFPVATVTVPLTETVSPTFANWHASPIESPSQFS